MNISNIALFDSFDNQEYLCGIITGSHRRGKTLLLAILGSLCYKKYDKVYTNFELKIPNVEIIDDIDLTKIDSGSLVLITELHHYIDCRTSMSESQINLTQTLQELGKKHCCFFGDIKETCMLDKRMRDLFTVSIYAFGSRKRLGEQYKDIYKYAIYRDINLNYLLEYPERYFYLNAKPFYDKYNTLEFITLKEDKKEIKKVKKLTDY